MKIGYRFTIILAHAVCAAGIVASLLWYQHRQFEGSLLFTPTAPGFTDLAPRFAGEGCAGDCSAHLHGYETALLLDVRREAVCKRYKGPHQEGCLYRVSERNEARGPAR